MEYNSKNYQAQGGDEWVVGGKLTIEDGAKLEGFPKASNQAESTATTISDLKTDFNAMLEKLKSAGLMESD